MIEMIKKGIFMIKILGVNYINEKEAASRYGHSASWFQNRRKDKLLPNYVKIGGKVLYELDKTDEWFNKNIFKTDYV
jgi:predicted DNA-binding transcriptional regulator AlpA